jgi:hypothetical protein|eukprot:COSAG06_NODE_252_length_19068_cov_7.774105_1_plen_194_part_00
MLLRVVALGLALPALGLALPGLALPALPAGSLAITTEAACSVMEHGAKGDGVTLDSAAISAAIKACDHVVFPAEKQFLTGSIELRSNLTLEVLGTILGAKGSIAIPPKNPFMAANPFEGDPKNPGCPFAQQPSQWRTAPGCGGYQDYGHSYWAVSTEAIQPVAWEDWDLWVFSDGLLDSRTPYSTALACTTSA